MYRKISFTLFTAALLAIDARPVTAQVITQWNFNSTVNDASPATGVTTPSTGAGILTLVGGTTGNPTSAGSPGDPNTTDNSGLQTSTYPAQGTGSGTAGVQFAVSTSGFVQAIQISLDFRQSGTQSRSFQLQLSTDGTTFVNAAGGVAAVAGPLNSNANTSFSNSGLFINDAGTNQTFVQGISYTLPGGNIYGNDTNFAFRWVSVFDPTAGAYVASNPASTYAATGTARFDLVSVAAVPEPSIFVLITCGLGVLGLRLRGRCQRLGI